MPHFSPVFSSKNNKKQLFFVKKTKKTGFLMSF